MKEENFVFDPKDWKTPNTYDTNFASPTEKSGVYLLVKPTILQESIEYEIMYVGSAKQLNVRYQKHEVLRMLKEFYGYIQFYFKEVEMYREIEKKLIKKIQPKFNKQWR